MATSSLYTLPDPTAFFGLMGQWSGAMFRELWPITLVIAGLIIGGYLLSFFLSSIPYLFNLLFDWIFHREKKSDSVTDGLFKNFELKATATRKFKLDE